MPRTEIYRTRNSTERLIPSFTISNLSLTISNLSLAISNLSLAISNLSFLNFTLCVSSVYIYDIHKYGCFIKIIITYIK